jgi:protein-disulfide isomerase
MKLPVYLLLLAGLPGLVSAADIDRAKAFGNPSAPLTIELFSDFECPHCRALHMEEMPYLMRDFVNTGKAYLIYKEFPLPGHQFARQAAAYACASARIGKYQEVADAIFQAQPVWEQNGNVFQAVASVLTPAEQKKVETLAKDPSVVGEVQRDVQEGQLDQVNETPTMLIIRNGKKYPIGGTLNYDLLRRFLNELIAK